MSLDLYSLADKQVMYSYHHIILSNFNKQNWSVVNYRPILLALVQYNIVVCALTVLEASSSIYVDVAVCFSKKASLQEVIVSMCATSEDMENLKA